MLGCKVHRLIISRLKEKIVGFSPSSLIFDNIFLLFNEALTAQEPRMSTYLDQLAFQFFKLFAQYESTLKERGLFKSDRLGNISVDWDRFANEIVGNNFRVELAQSVHAADYILDQPPKKQIADNGKVVWADVPATEKSVQILFGHICRVRNNLFHGAKFNGTWFDPVRSEELLTHSLAVLEHFRTKAGV